MNNKEMTTDTFNTAKQILIKAVRKNPTITQLDMVRILSDNNINIAQGTLSKYKLDEFGIYKNDNGRGYYVGSDEEKNNLRNLINNLFTYANFSIIKPMLHATNPSNDLNDEKNNLYSITMYIDNGYEGAAYNLIKDYLGTSNMRCLMGTSCIQVIVKDLDKAKKLYNKIKNITK